MTGLQNFKRISWREIALSCLLLASCEGRPLDIEPLEGGSFALNVSGSTLTGGIESARAKAFKEASKYCQRDGRDAVVTNETAKSDPDWGSVLAHIDFNCAPKPLRR